MKNFITLVLLLITQSIFANVHQDSLLIKIDKRDQKLLGNTLANGKTLKEELEFQFRKKNIVLTDSIWQNIRKMIQSESESDSNNELNVQVGNQQVKISIEKRQDIRERLEERKELGDERNDRRENRKEEIKIGLNGVHVVDGNEEVHVDWNGVYVKEGNGSHTKVIWGQDTSRINPRERKLNLYSRRGLNFYLGLNGLTGNIPNVQPAIYPPIYLDTDLNLKPLSSRYVYLEIARSATVKVYAKSALKIGYGLGIEWYNFMFDHNRVVQNLNNIAAFQPVFDATNKELRFTKNKLSVSYITIPIMPYISFPQSSTFQMIAFGGYFSYRIDSWTKTIEEKNDNLVKNTNSFNLNPFRYGLKAEFAIKHFPDIFFNYDLSPLFDVNRGPKMTGFSFGIKLL
jgi:hypothetical protein